MLCSGLWFLRAKDELEKGLRNNGRVKVCGAGHDGKCDISRTTLVTTTFIFLYHHSWKHALVINLEIRSLVSASDRPQRQSSYLYILNFRSS